MCVRRKGKKTEWKKQMAYALRKQKQCIFYIIHCSSKTVLDCMLLSSKCSVFGNSEELNYLGWFLFGILKTENYFEVTKRKLLSFQVPGIDKRAVLEDKVPFLIPKEDEALLCEGTSVTHLLSSKLQRIPWSHSRLFCKAWVIFSLF